MYIRLRIYVYMLVFVNAHLPIVHIYIHVYEYAYMRVCIRVTYIHTHMISLLLYCAGRVHPPAGPSWKSAAVLVGEASANIDILFSKMLTQCVLEDNM